MSLCRINRAQILDDSFNLARADLLDYPTALANTEYLILETDFIPWSSALTGFSYLENMMKRSPGFGDLKTYLLATLQPLYDRLGFQARRIRNREKLFLALKGLDNTSLPLMAVT